MNPYVFLMRQSGAGDVGDLVDQLGAWHDSMVLHQRTVRQRGVAEACDETCAHAVGRVLWAEAKTRLGPAATSLTFLKRSVGSES